MSLFAALSEDDVYRRFFTGRPPPQSFIERMARIEEHGGVGLAAFVEDTDGSSRMVGEASCHLLPDGNGELGITVAEHARGWLGPYLLDALVNKLAPTVWPTSRPMCWSPIAACSRCCAAGGSR